MTKKHDLEKQITDLENSRKRIAAEFENYKKRIEAQKNESIEFATANFMTEITIVIDSFERALIDTPDDAFSQGMTQIKKQLEGILFSKGLKQIEVKPGDKFDHNFHEATSSEINDLPEGTIIAEFASGWKLKDRVIKPAKVRVSKGK